METFHCPDDHGCLIGVHPHLREPIYKPSCWEVGGCSYMYAVDYGPWSLRWKLMEPDGILAGNKLGWVPNPSLFILEHEPPARGFGLKNRRGTLESIFQHWHYAPMGQWREMPNPDDSSAPYLKSNGRKFISPVLFVDGHVATHDFTHVIKSDPEHPYEATKDWIWYKPRRP